MAINGAPACVFFWDKDGENGAFSNWFDSPFVIDDFAYRHVEQYLMAQKAKLFHDAERYTAILRAATPKECKALGREVTPFIPEQWEAVRFEVAKTALRQKFLQNPELMNLLLATGDSILAEASPFDKVWGIGLSAHKAAACPPEQWPGLNLLGKALMEVRGELRQK